MAYKTKDLEKQSLKAIEQHKLFFIEDVVSFLPCDKSTFYAHKLHESDAIKEALNKQRTAVKVSMRSKWFKSDNATLQVALMKLIATDDERKKLAQQFTDVTSNGETLKTALVEFIGEDKE